MFSRTFSKSRAVRLAAGMLSLAALSLGFASPAKAWWNDEWSMRKQITIDTSSAGANITDPVGTTPVLVRLHVGNFRFGSAKPDGSDLRFIAGDDKTPLKHHVEKFDSLLGEALVWVGVTNVQPGAKNTIWLYYANKKVGSANDPKGTYDPDTLLVYHFGERGVPAIDSSAWANNSQNAGSPADGSLIGNGLRLDGKAPLTLPASPSMAIAENGAWTWSAWIKPAALQRNAAIYSSRDARNAIVIGIDDGSPFVELNVAGAVQRTAAAGPMAPGGWHHVAVVATFGLVTLYVDGAPYGTLSASLPALSAIGLVGADAGAAAPAAAPAAADAAATPPADGAAPAADAAASPAAPAASASGFAAYVGDLDELSISKVARPLGFIKLLATSQGPDPSRLVLFSTDEETASWFSGYFSVLLKAVTLDGWIVISILAVMAVASWVVMVEKHVFLNRQRKGNDEFLPSFRKLKHDLTLLADETVLSPFTEIEDKEEKAKPEDKQKSILRYSALNRVYQIGADEIRRRFPENADGQTHALGPDSIAAIRSAMDAGLVREIQALNRLMVILTISISGGPFLGLLGTVIGVMITFAAIAMSGDVNINAIAPGVAGALMATVTGLAVAIPALFGYNWLTLRIKDLTSDLQVFVDEFTTKMAEVYNIDRPGPMVPRMAAE